MWLMIYNTEKELLESLKEIDVNEFNELCNKNICKGYQNITLMVRRLNSGGTLTPAQIRLAKRMASQIEKYHLNKGELCKS